jgi:hypothetical protein
MTNVIDDRGTCGTCDSGFTVAADGNGERLCAAHAVQAGQRGDDSLVWDDDCNQNDMVRAGYRTDGTYAGSCKTCGANLAENIGDGVRGHWRNCTRPPFGDDDRCTTCGAHISEPCDPGCERAQD